MILAATRDTTRAVYKGRWEHFVSWCSKGGDNPIRTSQKHILDFLQAKSETLAVNTIKGYVTFIAHRHALVHGNLLSQDPVLKRWINGLEYSKGIPDMITPTRCLELVLATLTKDPFEPIVTCSLKYLTWKTAFLLVTSARSASEMHALRCKALYIRFSNAGVTLFTKLGFHPKVATKANTSRPICVPVKHNQKDRILHALNEYLWRTSDVRQQALPNSLLPMAD